MAELVSQDIRESSETVYNHKWQVFCDWCKGKGINTTTAKSQDVADFLLMLFVEKGLAVKTIMGYKAAISKTLMFTSKVDLNDQYLRALLSNFHNNRPANCTEYPKWNLSLVLNALTSEPYEPMKEASMLAWTKKTAFLLLLASGARRSEIHALDIKSCYIADDKKSMFLKPRKKFLAKNHQTSTGRGRFQGFWIKSMADYLGADMHDVDGTLCPVRAMTEYMERTKNSRKDIRQLLLAVPRSKSHKIKPANKNTISSWIKHVVGEAYLNVPDDSPYRLDRSAHEVRALAASLCAYKNVAIDSILAQCRWQRESTFSSFYLREMRGTEDGMHRLPPFMAAGAVITPGQSPTAP